MGLRKYSFYKLTGIRTGFIAAFLFAAQISSCKKPYNPPAINASANYLVIEGLINSGNDSTIIKITRTVNIANKKEDSVTNATVTVEDDHSGSFPLNEKKPGIYVSAPLSIDKTRQYRLRVKTAGNREYLSDFVPVQTTPAIDSVGYNIEADGLQVYVNTHDATNAVQYYRWDYDETWQFHTEFESAFVLRPGNKIVDRPASEQIYYCFGSAVSSDIPLATTVKANQDVLYQTPIALVPSSSEKLEMRYSILVRQYAITAGAYAYYSALKKNTEQLGSIFDALPSSIQGNVHCITNPGEPVVGYISVNNITSKRIYVSNTSLPATFAYKSPYNCIINPFVTGDIIAYLETHPDAAYFITSSSLATPECSNCATRGSLKKPSFWVY